ncbi:MAG: MBOAT family protein, partial [Rhodospirillales bacterium]
MLFNSYEFIFGFLPVTYAVYFLAARLDQRLALLWLGGASIFFYGWWNWMYVPLLLGSIAFNFHMGSWLTRLYRGGGNRRVFWALCFGVALNLALLAYYKYAGFLSFSLAGLTGAGVPDFVRSIILPLGISFFTFTQIAFLADAAQGKAADADPVSYVLFVTFFPHLIAGPILHHGEMMPQFRRPGILRPDMARISAGLACFVMGLFKKAVLADNIAPFANAVFDAAAQGAAPTLLESWLGALAYSLQIYFDFSGYTDMALGLAYMIGIRLPMNFNSPYKAASPIEFWRRWHMTLSRFLRDYLYFPLRKNRKGPARRHLNLMITMVLGGLWHGASWTFVVWGTLHGLFL